MERDTSLILTSSKTLPTALPRVMIRFYSTPKTMLGKDLSLITKAMELIKITKTDLITGANALLNKKTQDVLQEITEKTRRDPSALRRLLFMNLVTTHQILPFIMLPKELATTSGQLTTKWSQLSKGTWQLWELDHLSGTDLTLL